DVHTSTRLPTNSGGASRPGARSRPGTATRSAARTSTVGYACSRRPMLPSSPCSTRRQTQPEPLPPIEYWRSTDGNAGRNEGSVCGPGATDRSAGRGSERWVLEHPGPVLDELDAAVEGAVVDHLQGDVGIAVVDALCSRGACDHREHHDAEAIDESGSQQRPAKAEAADRAPQTQPALFHRPTALIASSRTSVELAHASGSSSDAENTTFDARVSSSTDASLSV